MSGVTLCVDSSGPQWALGTILQTKQASLMMRKGVGLLPVAEAHGELVSQGLAQRGLACARRAVQQHHAAHRRVRTGHEIALCG